MAGCPSPTGRRPPDGLAPPAEPGGPQARRQGGVPAPGRGRSGSQVPPPFLHLPGSGHFLSPSAHSHGPLRSRGRGGVRKWGEVTHFAEHLLQPARWAPLRAEHPGRRGRGARGAGGAEPDARGGRRVPSPKELRSRAARGRMRGGGGGPRAQERLNCAKASALPARAPAGHRAAASPRRGAGREGAGGRGRGPLFGARAGTRPASALGEFSWHRGRRAGRSGSRAAARAGGSGSPGSAPAPAPGTHFVQDAPRSALWAGAGGPSASARSPEELRG